MSFISKMKVGRHTYLYEVTAYRDEQGRPRNKKHPVGKLDPVTGEPIYKPEYLAKCEAEGNPIASSSSEPLASYTTEDIKRSTIKEFGAFYFMNSIATKVGLTSSLQEAFPDKWVSLLTLAIYLVCTEDPFLYCSRWLESTETLPAGNLTSQRISDLLRAISPEERSRFFSKWGQHRTEQEYLALDITPVSSWSQWIEDVEWGYNRDHEKLPQINLCLLMGERSRLPLFQTVYSGSLKDVSTLDSTLQMVRSYAKDRPLLLVMDKGFYSKKNVDRLLNPQKSYRFILPVSFTSAFAKKQVESEKKDIDTLANTLVSGKDSFRAVTKQRAWGNGEKVYTHIYFNAQKASKRKEDLYAHVAMLVEEAKQNPDNKTWKKEFERYLLIRSSSKKAEGFTVSIREEIVDKELAHSGWLVLISNDVRTAKEALSIYRSKDVVEKGFLRLKQSINLGRLRVHSQESMQNKVFLGFLSLILLSHIHTIMVEKDLYKRMTVKELIISLKKLRVQTIQDNRILFPLSREQKTIFEAFSIQEPV